MKYTDKQIEEALSGTMMPQDLGELDRHYKTRRKRHLEYAKTLMRMVREEARLSLLDHVVKNHSITVLGDFPALPEFWEEPQKLATESQWQPIGTAPKDGRILFVVGTASCPQVAYWSCSEERWVTPENHEYHRPTHWMPIPGLPK